MSIPSTRRPAGARRIQNLLAVAVGGALFFSVLPTALADCGALSADAAARAVTANQGLNRSADRRRDRELEIYLPLMQQMVGTQAGLFSAPFASALACWQAAHGLAPTGVVNGSTFQAMKFLWQVRRLEAGHARQVALEALAEVPVAIRYVLNGAPKSDARYAKREALEALMAMRRAALEDREVGPLVAARESQHLSVVSAFRSLELNAAIKRATGANGFAVANRSVHMTGTAFDLYVGGERASTDNANRLRQVYDYPTYRWLLKNARRFGFVNYYYEPWHWEYVGPPEDGGSGGRVVAAGANAG